MKNSVEFLSETRAVVTIEVPIDEFATAYEKTIKDTGKTVTIPGFRRGKAPRRVLEANLNKHALIDQTVQDNLDSYYQQALTELELVPMSQPEVELDAHPHLDGSEDDSPLRAIITTTVRPEIILPDPSTMTVTIADLEATDDDVELELNDLRERFATLTDVDREAAEGDYVNIDLVATIDGQEVDDMTGVSYKIGEGNMLDGQDEALTGAKAGDEVEFNAVLKGGDNEGQEADVKITVHSVKESVLPEADDEFAMMASEFDTIEELREDLKNTAKQNKGQARAIEAQSALLEQLLDAAEFELPEGLVDEEVGNHLTQEGKALDDPHGEEIRGDVEEALRTQLLLDAYAKAFNVDVQQGELINFLMGQAQTYGMDPNQFIQAAIQTNQLNAFAGEVARNKSVVSALRLANVVLENGEKVDLDEFLGERDENETEFDFSAQKKRRKVNADAARKAQAAKAEKKDADEAEAKSEKKDAEPKTEKVEDKADEAFNPSNHTVAEVTEYLAGVDEDEKARVIEAEKAGKARKGVLSLAS